MDHIVSEINAMSCYVNYRNYRHLFN